MSLTATKYDQEIEFFGLDWGQRGASVANPITTSAWTVPSPLTSSADTFTGTTSQIRLGGGVQGASYSVINVITVSNGQTLEAVLVLKINRI
jgi:hypothetical protein